MLMPSEMWKMRALELLLWNVILAVYTNCHCQLSGRRAFSTGLLFREHWLIYFLRGTDLVTDAEGMASLVVGIGKAFFPSLSLAMAFSVVKETLGILNKDSYVNLLSKLIGESKYVQNNPPGLIPQEDRVVKHILDVLLPLSTKAGGGPLVINHVTYFPGRGNLIVEYPGTEPGKILSFVGMHLDVVTAIPNDWDFDPFSLSIDGEKLRGRGTTDCSGHVALVAELMKKLGETKPELKSTVVAVFIASEENSAIRGLGVDALVKDGLLNKLKGGPLFWIDTADKQPCIGTGGLIPWKLHVTGKLFHSGLAHKAINPLELAMEALKEIQTRFYKDFPPHPKE